jgi:hypothetical protein
MACGISKFKHKIICAPDARLKFQEYAWNRSESDRNKDRNKDAIELFGKSLRTMAQSSLRTMAKSSLRTMAKSSLRTMAQSSLRTMAQSRCSSVDRSTHWFQHDVDVTGQWESASAVVEPDGRVYPILRRNPIHSREENT